MLDFMLSDTYTHVVIPFFLFCYPLCPIILLSCQANSFHVAVMAGWHCSSLSPLWNAPPLSRAFCLFECAAKREFVSVRPSLLWLPLVPLTCHPCSMTACRRWPGMVWSTEYPWAKLDCKTLPAYSTLSMTPGPQPTSPSTCSLWSPRTPLSYWLAAVLHLKVSYYC